MIHMRRQIICKGLNWRPWKRGINNNSITMLSHQKKFFLNTTTTSTSTSTSTTTTKTKTNAMKYLPRLNWNVINNDEIYKMAQTIEKDIQNNYDRIAALSRTNLNANTLLLPEIRSAQQLSFSFSLMSLLQYVSPHSKIRDTCVEMNQHLYKFLIDTRMRKDVYNQFQIYWNEIYSKEQQQQQQQKKFNNMDKEWERLLKIIMRDYRRNGLGLNEKEYEKLKEITKRMSDLSISFESNLSNYKAVFKFTRKELEGLDEDWLNAHRSSEDSNYYHVTLQYPDYIPLMETCVVDSTRAKMELEFNSRCKHENSKIMEELIQLRQQRSLLLGYSNHSDYVCEIRMSKSSQRVSKFLQDLWGRMKILSQRDLEALLELKKSHKKQRGESFDGIIHPYDLKFYGHMRMEHECKIDNNKIKEYFPLGQVINGCLEIYQQLLSLEFIRVNTSPSTSIQLWHEDVQLYEVVDVSRDRRVMGYFMLDLYPREGKYTHACMTTVQSGCTIYNEEGQDVGQQIPVNVMICNFTKPSQSKPSLLSHNEVTTFFHEFGHVMHQICGQPKLAKFSGTSVERDFVETPSQMFENWCWQKESLKMMSGHYKNNTKIPDEMIEGIQKSKTINSGLHNARQLYFGMLDQYIHSGQFDVQKETTEQLCARMSKEIWGIEATKNTNFLATFGHLAGGYDATYYGYLWSEVISSDMFQTKFGEQNLLDKTTGLKFRNAVLSWGGSKDAMEMIIDFLGREPNMDAFFKEKGLLNNI